MSKLPMQPIELDPDDGTPRFKLNPIVVWLLDAGPFDMNQLAILPNISKEERSQFAQLIGYSVSGYGELSYAVDVHEADEIADQLVSEVKPAPDVMAQVACPGPVKEGHRCKLAAGHEGMHEVADD